MKRLEQEQEIRHSRRAKGLVMVAVVLLVLLSVGRVFAANRLVGASEELRCLDQEEGQLESKNQVLAEEVRRLEAVAGVTERAEKMGFVPTALYSFVLPPRMMAAGVLMAP
jgi:cell division protein FtsL